MDFMRGNTQTEYNLTSANTSATCGNEHIFLIGSKHCLCGKIRTDIDRMIEESIRDNADLWRRMSDECLRDHADLWRRLADL